MAARRTATAPSTAQDGRRAPPPPSDLGEAGLDLWRAVTGAYDVAPHLLVVLESAARELDRAERAEQAVAEAGEWTSDRYGGVRAHPGISVARSSRLAAGRLLRQVDLELPTAGLGRKPHGGIRRQDGAA
jgi:hypothetical protein